MMDLNEGQIAVEDIRQWKRNDQTRRQGIDKLQNI